MGYSKDSEGVVVKNEAGAVEQINPLDVELSTSGSLVGPKNPLPVQLDGDFAINVQVDSGDSQIEYIGKAAIGSATSAAAWKIKRVNYTTGTVIEYADSNEDFDNIFDNRESLTYG